MSLLPYPLARAALFCLDAETAHDITLASLAATQHTPLSKLYAQPRVADPFELAGLILPNRVGLAAGLDKNARCIDAFTHMGFGFVEVGTVTPKAQPGNDKPRMFRLPKANALINRLGFNNHGLDAFVANVQQARLRSHMVLGLNIGKNAATPIEDATSDYLLGLAGVYAHADYVTVNISSPNTKNLRELQSDQALDSLLDALSQAREQLASTHGKRKPIFVKIAPDLDDTQIGVIAQVLKRYGCNASGQANSDWGLIATNTTLARHAVQGMAHANETGGLSGEPVFEPSNRVITAMRQALGTGFPIIGVGGVDSAAKAVGKIQAGADAVQLYTGFIYKGPALVHEAAVALQQLGTQAR
ncbi:MAG: quinone-dependent dihydroorotate dehydrogenase [Burkholderiaceae bacterium]|nr:quinone-dependent dihydroorotate dehydrogenase [Burkholderiaceae bacterium]